MMEDSCYIYEQFPVASNKSWKYPLDPQRHFLPPLTTLIQLREGKRYLPQEIYDPLAVPISRYSFENLYLSFNGGKDATVVLFLTLLAMQEY